MTQQKCLLILANLCTRVTIIMAQQISLSRILKVSKQVSSFKIEAQKKTNLT
jgi:hypothetical protein